VRQAGFTLADRTRRAAVVAISVSAGAAPPADSAPGAKVDVQA
jgi:hypothetical protein